MKQQNSKENVDPVNILDQMKKIQIAQDGSDEDLSTLDDLAMRKSQSTPERKKSTGKSVSKRKNLRNDILKGLDIKNNIKQEQSREISENKSDQKQSESCQNVENVDLLNNQVTKRQNYKKPKNYYSYNYNQNYFNTNQMYVRQSYQTYQQQQLPFFDLLTYNNNSASNQEFNNQIKKNENEVNEQLKEENRQKIQKSKQIQDEYKLNPLGVFDSQIKNNFQDLVTGKYDYFVILNIINANINQDHVQFILNELQQQFEFYVNHQTAYKVVEASMELSSQNQKIYGKYYVFWSDYVMENSINYVLPTQQYGNYIVSKAISLFKGWRENQLITSIDKNLLNNENNEDQVCLSSNQYGCLMIQTLIEKYKYHLKLENSESLEILNKIMEKIEENVVKLSQQQFSNYIVQQVLLKGDVELRDRIQDKIIFNHFQNLSEDKYGSNIIEKILETSSDAKRFEILKIVIDEKKTMLKDLVNDKYGNYVIKKMYGTGTQQIRKELYHQLNALKIKKQLTEYGNHAINYMEQEHNRLMYQQYYNNQLNNFNQNQYQYQNQYQQYPVWQQQQQQQAIYQSYYNNSNNNFQQRQNKKVNNQQYKNKQNKNQQQKNQKNNPINTTNQNQIDVQQNTFVNLNQNQSQFEQQYQIKNK